MQSMIDVFSKVQDFRMNRTKKHKLLDIISIAILATIAGAEGYNEIADWGVAKKDWLKKFLDLPEGIPSHDTFRRVLGALDPDVFQLSFSEWVASVNMLLDHKVVAIDGKTLRRSFDPIHNKRPLHLVSAWACEAQLSLGQIQVDQKSNEITAIPALLETLELKGAIVTLDAMGCQKNIAHKIVEKGADYVLALKKNHGDLHAHVAVAFQLKSAISFNVACSINEGHGRIEERTVMVSTTLDWLPQKNNWQGLKSVVRVDAVRQTVFGESKTTRYYLTSLSHDQTNKIASAIRSHWSIENQLHWSLDVVYHEDQSRVRDQRAAQNLALLRRLAITMIKNAPSHPGKSLKRKRFLASLEDNFLLEVVGITPN